MSASASASTVYASSTLYGAWLFSGVIQYKSGTGIRYAYVREIFYERGMLCTYRTTYSTLTRFAGEFNNLIHRLADYSAEYNITTEFWIVSTLRSPKK